MTILRKKVCAVHSKKCVFQGISEGAANDQARTAWATFRVAMTLALDCASAPVGAMAQNGQCAAIRSDLWLVADADPHLQQ